MIRPAGRSWSRASRPLLRRSLLVGLGLWLAAASPWSARADDGLPPWNDDDVPLPEWVRSVAVRKHDAALYLAPGKLDARRGSVSGAARLPLFGARRAPGCTGRWFLVGPLSWLCSDVAELSAEEPYRPVVPRSASGLPFRYFFAGRDGASGFSSLSRIADDVPDRELEPGFGVAIVQERTERGERYGLTRTGYWIAMRELAAARSSAFHGEQLTGPAGPLDLAWVLPDKASVYGAPRAMTKVTGVRIRHELLHVTRVESGFARVSPAGEPEAWVRLADLVRPGLASPPAEVGGPAARERWIDVELASQTLVAYEGTRPVFATLVSTGKGPPRSETATPPGVHRVWVKLLASKMDNLEREDLERHYSLDDVPYVQFFDRAIALHGAFWHQDFGHVHSHGCVNLAPLDAEWLFGFTGPHLPAGWSAVFPTRMEPGTAIRVR